MTLGSTFSGRGATGAQPAANTVPVGSLYYDTTLSQLQRSTGAAWEVCEPASGGGGGDVTYAQLLAMQFINEIKGWPPVVNTGDLDALNLWWDKVGTPTTAPSVQDTSAAGLTDDYELCLKVTADAAGEGLSQRFTYANEPRVKAGRRLSTLWAIWCVAGVGATLSLLNQSAEETAAAKVTAATWTIVEVPNHLLAGTYVDIKIAADGAGTFYAVPLGANIGARGLALRPRGLVLKDGLGVTVKDLTNLGDEAAWTDVDVLASTSPLAVRVDLTLTLYDTTSGDEFKVFTRRNGSAVDNSPGTGTQRSKIWGQYLKEISNSFCEMLDDGNIFEYYFDRVGGTGTLGSGVIALNGWWEWE